MTDTIQAAQRNLRTSSRIVGAGRDDYWEVEPEVIREAVVNALMHRDFRVTIPWKSLLTPEQPAWARRLNGGQDLSEV